MKYIKLMPCISLKNASRNKRELSVASEMGYEITVISSDKEPEKYNMPDNYKYIYDEVTVLNPSISRLKRYAIILKDRIKLIKKLKKIEKDVISCHNLQALLIGYLSVLFIPKHKKTKLIYDSHEFEIGLKSKRNKINQWCVIHLERFLMKHCVFSIMVNDSIADEVQKIHKLKQRPVVVRNTANYWQLDEAEIAEKRKDLCKKLGVREETFLVMYHGGVIPNRGVENMLRAVSRTENTAAVVLGNGNKKYLDGLHRLCVNLGIENRTLFHPAVAVEELWKYVGSADVGMVILLPVVKNHYYTLPNKYFENIQSLTPIICSNFPEVGGLTEKYNIGIAVDPADITEIKGAIEKLRDDKQYYIQLKENLKRAKEELCWEKEKVTLKEAYLKYLCPEKQMQ